MTASDVQHIAALLGGEELSDAEAERIAEVINKYVERIYSYD